MREAELLPCPFCGSAPGIVPKDPKREGDAWAAVHCENDECPTWEAVRNHGVRVSVFHDSHGESVAAAIAAWNTRGTREGLVMGNETRWRRPMLDLEQHLIRQMAFSHATYGPGERTAGVIDHIRKELVEVETAGGDSAEWVDVVILALDGLTRRLAFVGGRDRLDPEIVARLCCRMIAEKQARNEARVWPDWRTATPGKAIEHDRSEEAPK